MDAVFPFPVVFFQTGPSWIIDDIIITSILFSHSIQILRIGCSIKTTVLVLLPYYSTWCGNNGYGVIGSCGSNKTTVEQRPPDTTFLLLHNEGAVTPFSSASNISS